MLRFMSLTDQTLQMHRGLFEEDLADLFSTSPRIPWGPGTKFPDAIVTDDDGSVSLQGWLAQWR